MNKHSIEGRKPLNNFQHCLKIMRITLSFLFFCILFSSASNSYSQKFTIKSKTASIKEVCKEIEKGSDYVFIFSDNCEKLIDKQVNVEANSKDVMEVLDAVLSSTGLTYKILDKQIVVYKSTETTPSVAVEQPDMNIIQQPAKKQITGKVVDAQGDAIIGANIIEKGTSNGTISDVDGNFSLQVENSAILLISYIGFLTQEINTVGKTDFNIILQEDTKALDEVVVVGFGTQKKVNLTGAVSTATAAEIESRPVVNVSQALQGVVPGLNISQNNGMLDAQQSINIRGIATLDWSSGNARAVGGRPLILVDGMEADLNSLNPQDIESISVLKDAAASSIYGSRAPFGVILVTTKRGKVGKPTFNYNNDFRWSNPVFIPPVMDSYSFATYFNDARFNSGQNPTFSQSTMRRILSHQLGHSLTTDPNFHPYSATTKRWSAGYGDGAYNNNVYELYYERWQPSQNHNFSVSGGNEAINYYFSGGMLDQQGLMKLNKDKFKRFNITARIGSQITDWMDLTYTVRYSREDFKKPYYLNSTFLADLLRRGWPTQPFYDPNGYLLDGPMPALSIKDGGNDMTLRDRLNQQAQLVIEPIKNWRTFLEFNSRIDFNQRKWFTIPTFNHDIYGNPYTAQTATRSEIFEEVGKTDFWNVNIYTNYTKEIGEGHNLTGMLGFNAENNLWKNINLRRQGMLNNDKPEINLTTGFDKNGNPVDPSISGYTNDWATLGFFGRINYDYKSKYLLEFNSRYDATSRFRSDKRWGYFPSFSAGWNLAEEEFFEPLREYIDQIKPRFSYGESGNQSGGSGDYPTYQTMNVQMQASQWLINGALQNRVGSPGLISSLLTWERVRQTNYGLDFAAFNSRLSGGFDYFIRKTLNMVGPAPQMPATLGAGVPRTNNTDLEAFGFDLTLAWNDRIGTDIRYGLKLVLSDTQARITRYPNVSGALNSYRKGQMIGEIWGFVTKGIAKTTEEMDAHLASLPNGGQTSIGANWMAGDIMYTDLNGDGTINSGSGTIGDPGDMKIIGNESPRYQYGLDLTASYKDFDFRAFFQGIGSRQFFRDAQFFWGANSRGLWESTGFTPHLDYFRDDPQHYLGLNLDSYFHRPLFNTNKNERVQTRYLQDASYVRLKNLQIGYNLPSSLLNKTFLSRVRLFISAENLWTYTKMFEVFDPETVDGGTYGNVYPLSKSFAFGLNINF